MISKIMKALQKWQLAPSKKRRYISPDKNYASYGLLSSDPPIFYVSHWMNEELAFLFSMEKIFEYLRNRSAYFLYCWMWNIDEPEWVKLVRHFEEHHLRRYRKHRFIHLCNTIRQWEEFQKNGLTAVFCNHNAFIDESIFKPLPAIPKKYDAIYDARFKDYKRHYLASEVESLVLLYDFDPVIDDLDYVEQVKRQFPQAIFLNHLDSESYRKLTPEEVNESLNASRVGLCLSRIEGAMYASIQYLLSGLPVVSTESKGGRDVFFDDDFVLIVEDKPGAVREGVQEVIERCPSPEMIRNKTIDKIRSYRETLISVVQNIYDTEGIDRDFASEWNKVFFNKLCKYQKHPDVIEYLEEKAQVVS